MNLQNITAVVTGASKGLGLAFSQALIERGAFVFGLARNADQLNEVQSKLGKQFIPLPCDVTDENGVSTAFERVIRDRNRLDVLINNAGLGRHGKTETLSKEDWDVLMNTNVIGTFFCTRAALPQMKRQNEREGFGGHIVNIASIAGLIGNPDLTAYNASKFAVRGYSEGLMKEVRDDGIKITCVYPGSVDTNFFATAQMDRAKFALRAQDVAETVVHILSMPDNYLVSEVVMRPLRPR